MGKNDIIWLALGLGLMGVAGFVILKSRPVEKPDPIGNLLGVAPGAINAAGNIVSAGVGSVKGIVGSLNPF